jgi:hypothetical protein
MSLGFTSPSGDEDVAVGRIGGYEIPSVTFFLELVSRL